MTSREDILVALDNFVSKLSAKQKSDLWNMFYKMSKDASLGGELLFSNCTIGDLWNTIGVHDQ